MKIPEHVKQYADEHHFGTVEYAGKIGEDTYYERHYNEDKDGIVEPTGFPDLLKEDAKGVITWICGPEVISIMRELFGDGMI